MRWLPLFAICCLAAQNPEPKSFDYDVLILGGKIVDGAGSGWSYADLGIRGDTIAAMGHLATS